MRLSFPFSRTIYTGFLLSRVLLGVKAQTKITISPTVESFINITTLADGLMIKYISDALDHHSIADEFPNAALPNITSQFELLLSQFAAHDLELQLELTQGNSVSNVPALNCNPDFSALITDYNTYIQGLLYISSILGATINGQIVSAVGDSTFTPFINTAIAHTGLFVNIVTIAQQLVVGPGFGPLVGLLSASALTPVETDAALTSFLGSCSFSTTGSDITPVVYTPNGDASKSLISRLIVNNNTAITIDTTQLGDNCLNENALFCQYISLPDSFPTLGTGLTIQPIEDCNLVSEGVTLLYVTKDKQPISEDLTDRLERPQPSNSCAGPTVVYVNSIAGLEHLAEQGSNISFID